jgi:hypothetical protein
MEDEHILRYRCHIGHAYSSESLSLDQAEALERALGVALRTLDDTAALTARLCDEAERNNRVQSALLFRRRSEEAKTNANIIRDILIQQQQRRPGAVPQAKAEFLAEGQGVTGANRSEATPVSTEKDAGIVRSRKRAKGVRESALRVERDGEKGTQKVSASGYSK